MIGGNLIPKSAGPRGVALFDNGGKKVRTKNYQGKKYGASRRVTDKGKSARVGKGPKRRKKHQKDNETHH